MGDWRPPETHGQWFRRRVDETWDFVVEHFAILLLFWMAVGLMFYVLHIAHHDADRELLSWSREVTAGVMGALLGLLTGAKVGSEMAKRKALEETKNGDSGQAPPV
jgi:hypothetical protein